MRRTALVFLVAIATGCVGSALQEAKLVGLAARETAEAAYLTIRIEYLLGNVSQETMNQARLLYARYVRAQTAYVEALRIWETRQIPADVEVLKASIVAIAAELRLLADGVAGRSHAATQPAGG